MGKVFENVPVSQVAFGDSYRIAVTPLVNGFMHKTHTVLKEKETKKKKLTAINVKYFFVMDG